MIYEFCAENVTLLDKALEAGAKRVELCDNLTVGGTTPSYGVIEAAVRMVETYDATVMTMIRPRGGDFVYSDLEIEIMLADIQKAKEAGSQGVVFGVLTEKNEIDVSKMQRLLEACKARERPAPRFSHPQAGFGQVRRKRSKFNGSKNGFRAISTRTSCYQSRSEKRRAPAMRACQQGQQLTSPPA